MKHMVVSEFAFARWLDGVCIEQEWMAEYPGALSSQALRIGVQLAESANTLSALER